VSVDTLVCQELVELATDYLEGRLSWVDRARVDVHLAGCEHCAAYLEQLRQTIRLTGRLRERDLASELRAALLAAFREFDREERR
jgi:anti-sigma factor RsiW